MAKKYVYIPGSPDPIYLETLTESERQEVYKAIQNIADITDKADDTPEEISRETIQRLSTLRRKSEVEHLLALKDNVDMIKQDVKDIVDNTSFADFSSFFYWELSHLLDESGEPTKAFYQVRNDPKGRAGIFLGEVLDAHTFLYVACFDDKGKACDEWEEYTDAIIREKLKSWKAELAELENHPDIPKKYRKSLLQSLFTQSNLARVAKAKYFTYTTNIIALSLQDTFDKMLREEIDGQWKLVEVWDKLPAATGITKAAGKKLEYPIYVYVCLGGTFETEDIRLTAFDRMVLDAYITLHQNGNRKVSTTDICRVMNGYNVSKPRETTDEEIKQSLLKLRSIPIKIRIEELIEAKRIDTKKATDNGWKADGNYWERDFQSLILFDEIKTGRYGSNYYAIEMNDAPPAIVAFNNVFSDKQYLSIPIKILDVYNFNSAVSVTKQNLVITYNLAKCIKLIKDRGRNKSIDLEKLLKDCDISVTNRTTRRRAEDTIEKILTLWKQETYISKFEFVDNMGGKWENLKDKKNNQKLVSIEITAKRDKDIDKLAEQVEQKAKKLTKKKAK